jgi:hypothetical protein
LKPNTVVHACNPSTGKAEAGESQIPVWGLNGETLPSLLCTPPTTPPKKKKENESHGGKSPGIPELCSQKAFKVSITDLFH